MSRYRFGPFELDPGEGTLSRNGMRVPLQDLPYRLLLMLVERPGELVAREQVRQQLWPENTFVEFDNSLGVAIRKVRESLNDNAESPQYVATVPRRGFRFVAAVMVQAAEEPAGTKEFPQKPAGRTEVAVSGIPANPTFFRRNRYWVATGLVLLLRAAEAEASLRRWKERFHQEQQADDELAASVGLTEALLAQGKQLDAQKETERGDELASKSQNLSARLQYDLASARVLLTSDHPAISKRRLEQILREARAHGLVGIEFEAMLATADLEKRSGHTALAQEQLVSLEGIARNKGFGLVARKAAAARG